MTRKTKAELLLLLVTLIWGSTFVITKNALDTTSPLAFISIRFVIATVLFTVIFYRKIDFNLSKISVAGWGVGLTMFLGYACQTVGLNYTSASHSGFITGLLVIFTPIFQIVIERKKLKKGTWFGVFLVLIGLFWLVNPTDNGQNTYFGDFLTLLCAIAFGLYIVLLDISSKKDNMYSLIFIQLISVAVGGMISAASIEVVIVDFNANLIYSAVYLAIFATIVSTYIQTRYQKETTPTKAAVIFTMEPVFSAILAFLFLGEMIGLMGIVGGMIIVVGLLLSEISNS